MDEVVTTTGRAAPLARAMLAALAVLAIPACMAAGAQPLPDPTRPPAALSAPVAGEGAAAAPSLPQLQSILVGRAPNGRRVAVIDGETVRLGESFHGARLVRVTDDEVTLVRGRERQTLRLYAQGGASTSKSATHAPQ